MLKLIGKGKVVVLMGSKADLKFGEEVMKVLNKFGIPCDIRVTSAHKGPDLTLKVVAEYEGCVLDCLINCRNIRFVNPKLIFCCSSSIHLLLGKLNPVVFVAIAGRSNGLGPTVSGNTTFPVINCPPLNADWGAQDVWSSIRLPSGFCIVLHRLKF